MGKVPVKVHRRCTDQQLETSSGSRKPCHPLYKSHCIQPEFLAYQPRSMQVQQVMFAKNPQCAGLTLQRNNCYAVFDLMCWDSVGSAAESSLVLLHQPAEDRIGLVIDQDASRLYFIQEDPELLQVDLKGWEDI